MAGRFGSGPALERLDVVPTAVGVRPEVLPDKVPLEDERGESGRVPNVPVLLPSTRGI